MSSGVALPAPIRLIGWPWLSVWPAVVMSADFTAFGDHVGLVCRSSAARPAMCGADIDVPLLKSKYDPAGLAIGGTAATTSTPGAVMSGFNRSPWLARLGPADENPITWGARCGLEITAVSEALAPAVSE